MLLLFYFLFIHVVLFLPGYVLIKESKLLRGRPALELVSGYAASLVFFALSIFAAYICGFSYQIIQIIGLAALVVSSYFFVSHKHWKDLAAFRLPLLCLIMLSALSTLLVSLPLTGNQPVIPDPEPLANRNYQVFDVKVLNIAQTNANDNYIPYRQAQFILNRSNPQTDSFINEWGVSFFQRTPLMGGVTAFILNLLGDRPPVDYIWSASATDPQLTFIKFQLTAHVLNALFLLPAFLLLSRLFDKKVAGITLLFLSVSQFFVYNSVFSWPKSLAAFFVLLSWVFLLQKDKRSIILCGIVGGAAYLTHDLSVLYIGTSFLILLFQKRFRDALIVGGISVFMAIPWIVTSALIFKRPSSFIYYPFSLKDIPQPQTDHGIISRFFHTSPLTIIWIKIQSLFYLLTPYQLLVDELREGWLKRLWGVGIYSIPGAVGLGLLVPAAVGVFKKFASRKLFWGLVIIPLILCVFIIGWPRGLGALHFAQPAVILLSGLGVFVVLKYFSGIKAFYVCLILFGLSVIQFIYFLLFSYDFNVGSWGSKKPLTILISMIVIITIAGFMLHRQIIKPLRSNLT